MTMPNIYSKLIEAIKKSGVPCYDCEVHETQVMCGSQYVAQDLLIAELRKLEEEENCDQGEPKQPKVYEAEITRLIEAKKKTL